MVGVGHLCSQRGGRIPVAVLVPSPGGHRDFQGRLRGPEAVAQGGPPSQPAEEGTAWEAVTLISGSGVTVEVSGRGETAWLLLTVVAAFPQRCGVHR